MKSSTPPMYVHSPPFPDWFIWQYKKKELRGKVGFFFVGKLPQETFFLKSEKTFLEYRAAKAAVVLLASNSDGCCMYYYY